MLNEHSNVRYTLMQRRHTQNEAAKSVIEILAKSSRQNASNELLVRRRHEAEATLPIACGAHRTENTGLNCT